VSEIPDADGNGKQKRKQKRKRRHAHADATANVWEIEDAVEGQVGPDLGCEANISQKPFI
jgi:hypothetical protein